ncbi:MAG: hypothetical protein IT561_06295, partial [Alphaproteobacteria bacterium]|nr:hypothetical protein [Alphaproteobacteria bacterium]
TQGVGACVDNGTVGLRTKSGKLLWYWTGEDTNQPEGAASAVLFRVSNW